MNIEILVRGKDPEENAKQFEQCLDIIKNAGVRWLYVCFGSQR